MANVSSVWIQVFGGGACVCLCVYMCLRRHVYGTNTCVLLLMGVESRMWHWLLFSDSVYLSLRQGLLLPWNLPSRPGCWPPSSREPPDSRAELTSASLCLALMWFLRIKLISHASCTFLSHLQLPAPEWRNFKYKIGWMPIQLHIAALWVFRALCHRDLTSELFASLQNQGCSTSKIKRGNWKSAKTTATNTNQRPHNGS